jgi:Flp pilus assembly protein TadG
MKPNITANQYRSRPPAGQSLVEFALVLPVLLLLILGAVDFGRLFSTKISLTNAAREGANYLARNPGDAKIGFTGTVATAKNESSLPNIEVQNIDCNPKEADGFCSRGGRAVVTATTKVNFIFGNFLSINSIELSSTVEMLVQ